MFAGSIPVFARPNPHVHHFNPQVLLIQSPFLLVKSPFLFVQSPFLLVQSPFLLVQSPFLLVQLPSLMMSRVPPRDKARIAEVGDVTGRRALEAKWPFSGLIYMNLCGFTWIYMKLYVLINVDS